MKIQQALRQKTKKTVLCSKSLGMLKQNKNSFLFWLLKTTVSTDKEKMLLLEKILKATDWELQGKNE